MSEVNPVEVLSEAKRLTQEGRYEDALRQHLWFHDHALEHDPALAGVRLSFALTAWLELGALHPPALDALVEVRDRKATAITSGAGSFDLFHDVTAINQNLGQEDRTVTLFHQLHQSDPGLAGQCYRVAEDALVSHREYRTCLAYLPDPLARLDELKYLRRVKLELAAENPAFGNEEFLEFAETSFAEGAARLIEVLRGTGRRADAERVLALAAAESEAARGLLGGSEPA